MLNSTDTFNDNNQKNKKRKVLNTISLILTLLYGVLNFCGCFEKYATCMIPNMDQIYEIGDKYLEEVHDINHVLIIVIVLVQIISIVKIKNSIFSFICSCFGSGVFLLHVPICNLLSELTSYIGKSATECKWSVFGFIVAGLALVNCIIQALLLYEYKKEEKVECIEGQITYEGR